MYLPAAHAETSIVALRKLIRNHPLGILTTAIPSHSYPLIQSSHIPFLLDLEDEHDENELGILRGHLARQNPQSKAIIDSLHSQSSKPSSTNDDNNNILEQEVLVLFNSPVHHYVTPKFYTETKPDTGKVVPTWNYAAAQVYGRAKIYHDSKDEESISYLSKQIDDLSRYAEESLMGFTGTEDRPKAWRVADAPEKYVQLLQKNIIGIEIRIERLEGKFKMSQDKKIGDRNGVVQGFEMLSTPMGLQMAEVVRERGRLKDSRKEEEKVS